MSPESWSPTRECTMKTLVKSCFGGAQTLSISDGLLDILNLLSWDLRACTFFVLRLIFAWRIFFGLPFVFGNFLVHQGFPMHQYHHNHLLPSVSHHSIDCRLSIATCYYQPFPLIQLSTWHWAPSVGEAVTVDTCIKRVPTSRLQPKFF